MEQQQSEAANGTDPKPQWADRLCRRGKHMFKPRGPKDQVCSECAAKPKPSKLAKLRLRQQLKAKMAKAAPQPKPKPVPVLAKDAGSMSAEQWLALGGFKVETVIAPSGAWFRAVP